MSDDSKTIAYAPGFILWLIAEFVITDPVLSYLFAWLSSFIIFYITIFSKFKYVNDDLSINNQILRPIIIIQLIFAGFMCCSSIFYFLDHLGYRYFTKIDFNLDIPNAQTHLIAQAQRLSLLAHAALVTGIILLTPKKNQNKRKFKVSSHISFDDFLTKFSVATFAGGVAMKFVPGFVQFSAAFTSISVFAGTFILVKGITYKNKKLLYVGAGLFFSNLVKASLSGFKEPILMSIIILGCLLFPVYKKATLLIGIPLLYGLIYILPTYVGVIRTQSWGEEGVSVEESRDAAFNTLLDEENDELIAENNWAFLAERISELSMFTKFIDNTPKVIDYYGFDICIDSFYALIPRVLWSNKPITEAVSMQRVYDANVISINSSVSAKTRPVVDAYLSFGTIGVFAFFILIGLIAQGLCNSCENMYGGYQFGTLIIMGAFSDTLWRGNNFEFMFNCLFYGYILVLIIQKILIATKVLIKLEFTETDNQDIFSLTNSNH